MKNSKNYKSLSDRRFSFLNIIRKIYLNKIQIIKMNLKNTILITGVAGFIGFSLAKRLLRKKNINIVGIDNLNSYYSKKLKLKD